MTWLKKLWRMRRLRSGDICWHYVVVNCTAVPCGEASVLKFRCDDHWVGRCDVHRSH